MFIDFFEIAFIVVPLLAPVAEKMGIDLVWFGVIIAINLQTSFLTPPFGFALFYLRSVAARNDYNDRISGARIPAVTTGQIYKGAIAFIVIQLFMIALVIANPNLVLGGLDKKADINLDEIKLEMPLDPDAEAKEEEEAEEASAEGEEKENGEEQEEAADDPAKALMEQMKKDAARKK
jgi:hypothetical protein